MESFAQGFKVSYNCSSALKPGLINADWTGDCCKFCNSVYSWEFTAYLIQIHHVLLGLFTPIFTSYPMFQGSVENPEWLKGVVPIDHGSSPQVSLQCFGTYLPPWAERTATSGNLCMVIEPKRCVEVVFIMICTWKYQVRVLGIRFALYDLWNMDTVCMICFIPSSEWFFIGADLSRTLLSLPRRSLQLSFFWDPGRSVENAANVFQIVLLVKK